MIFYYISFPSFGSIEEMDMIETAIIYIKRNKIKSMIIILIIATIILGEIIGLLLSNASEKSERDAYLYNGAALVMEALQRVIMMKSEK